MPRPRTISQTLAALASAIPLFRPGDSLPGANAPYSAGPLQSIPGRRSKAARLRRSLRASAIEGMLAEVVTACVGGAVLTGWALHLNLSPFLVGVLGALPFLGQLVQLPAAAVTSWLGHRRAALWTVMLSREVYLPLALLPVLPIGPVGQQRLLVGVAAASAVLGILGNNAWVAWMSELVPSRIRGRYFSRRTALCILGGTIAQVLAGELLDTAKIHGQIGPIFSLLAFAACVTGGFTTWLMGRQHDPAPGASHVAWEPSIALRPLREPAARRVMAFQLTWNCAIGVAAAFFSVHMLQNLKMGFLLVALYNAGVAAVRIVVAPVWGKAIDRFGVRPVLVACSFGMGFVPLLWLLPTPERLWPLAIDFFVSGTLWCGQGLAQFQLPLQVAPREGRPYYLAAFATAGGIAFAVASSVGGALAGWLPTRFVLGGHTVYAIEALFLLSSAGRFLAAWVGTRIIEPGAQPVGALLAVLRLKPEPVPALAVEPARRSP